LDCREYIAEYVSAHADGELLPQNRQAADEHVAKCASCRALLADEHSLKTLMRRDVAFVRTPPDVRLRIRAALGDIAESKVNREPSRSARPVARRRSRADRDSAIPRREERERPGPSRSGGWLWGSVGGAVATLIVIVALVAGHVGNRGAGITPAVPAFDMAIGKYLALERNFSPNVPAEAYANTDGTVYAWVQDRDPVRRIANDEASDTADDVARAYREMSMPDDLIDLSSAGYRLAGGRADTLPDGRPITYTLYASDLGTILSICYPDASMAAPVGAVNWLGMRSFYQYKGYSICMSFYPAGHFVSILVSRMPITQLLNDVAAADSALANK
jgi:hypothetical protein